MFFLLLGCLALWLLGWGLKQATKTRWLAIFVFLLVIVIAHVVLPEGHSFRMMSGETYRPSLILMAIGALVGAYGWGLQHLKSKARKQQVETKKPLFSSSELERYARHIVLREIGGPGQKALKEAKVLVIGAGGLGAPALQYLAAAGVGTIGVIDDDVVENTNLQRQVIHKDHNINKPKVFSAQEEMLAQNPHITVHPYHRRLDAECAVELVGAYDLVLDGCDNFETRYLVNETCTALGKPLVSGALAQWEGQISIFDPANGTPCYQCIFPNAPDPELAPNCSQAGVIGPLPGVIGSMMALEALKVITKAGAPLHSQMLIYDSLYGESRKIMLKPRVDCPNCADKQKE